MVDANNGPVDVDVDDIAARPHMCDVGLQAPLKLSQIHVSNNPHKGNYGWGSGLQVASCLPA